MKLSWNYPVQGRCHLANKSREFWILIAKLSTVVSYINILEITVYTWETDIHTELISPYMSVNWVSIGSGNGLSPIWCQANTWTNVVLFVNWTPGNKFQWNLNLNSLIFIQENAFKKAVCQNVALILSRGRWIKTPKAFKPFIKIFKVISQPVWPICLIYWCVSGAIFMANDPHVFSMQCFSVLGKCLSSWYRQCSQGLP